VGLFSPRGGGATGAERRELKCVCGVQHMWEFQLVIPILANLDGVPQTEETARQQQINTRGS